MFRVRSSLFLFPTVLLLAACDRDDGIKVYQVSKPENMPTPAIASPRGPQDMANTAVPLPPSSVEAPQWQLPAEWTEKTPGAMRRASFSAGPEGKVDISVTAFPGDVGGDLANVNRWRRQLQLEPVDEATLAQQIQAFEAQEITLKFVEIEGADTATLAGWTLHRGQSWFFKMTGPKEAVAAEKASFQAFLRSVFFHS